MDPQGEGQGQAKRPRLEVPSLASARQKTAAAVAAFDRQRTSTVPSQARTNPNLNSSSSTISSSNSNTSRLAGASASAAPQRHYLHEDLPAQPPRLSAAFPQHAAAAPAPAPRQAPNIMIRAGSGNGTGTAARPPMIPPSNRAAILVHRERQAKNPVLKYVRNVAVELADGIVPDFVLSESTCAIFVQVKYHLLHPQYLIGRIKELRRDWRLRLILCFVNAEDCKQPLLEINRMCLINDCTLVLTWSWQEAARYLESFKVYENKPPTSIQEKIDTDYMARLSDVLTSVRSINKTDVSTLAGSFGSLRAIGTASMEELALCPGLGEKKIQRLYHALHVPFKPTTAGSAPSGASTASRQGQGQGTSRPSSASSSSSSSKKKSKAPKAQPKANGVANGTSLGTTNTLGRRTGTAAAVPVPSMAFDDGPRGSDEDPTWDPDDCTDD